VNEMDEHDKTNTKPCPDCGRMLVKMSGFFNDSVDERMWHGDFWKCVCGYQRKRDHRER